MDRYCGPVKRWHPKRVSSASVSASHAHTHLPAQRVAPLLCRRHKVVWRQAAGRAAAIVDGLRGAKPLADGADDVVAHLARRHDELRRRLDAPRPPRRLCSGRLWLRRAAGRASAGLSWAQKGVPAPGRGVAVVACDHVLPRAARRQVDLAYERRRGAFRAARGHRLAAGRPAVGRERRRRPLRRAAAGGAPPRPAQPAGRRGRRRRSATAGRGRGRVAAGWGRRFGRPAEGRAAGWRRAFDVAAAALREQARRSLVDRFGGGVGGGSDARRWLGGAQRRRRVRRSVVLAQEGA